MPGRARSWARSAWRKSKTTSTANCSATSKSCAQLRIEHRDLDEVISRLSLDLHVDELQLKRLKKRKLLLKDQIARLESQLIPDLNA